MTLGWQTQVPEHRGSRTLSVTVRQAAPISRGRTSSVGEC